MIRFNDEPSGKIPAKKKSDALLHSIERYLNQTSRITEKKAYDAQQLVYDAWEAPTDAAQQKLIVRALGLDPANVDALLQAAAFTAPEGDEEMSKLF